MAGHTVEEIQKSVKVYMGVFVVLAVLTVVTVAVSYLHLNMTMAIVVALIVASVKGSLVAGYFMHLLSERGLVFWVLGFSAFFFIVCLVIPTFTHMGYPGQ